MREIGRGGKHLHWRERGHDRVRPKSSVCVKCERNRPFHARELLARAREILFSALLS